MKSLTLLSWNINSIRIRLDLLKEICKEIKPDVICLQETKVIDELFPIDYIKNELGLYHICFRGNKGYNGVAILSKLPFIELTDKELNKKEARDIAVKIEDIEIHNLYVPAGGPIPDVENNPKFAQKLKFFEDLNKWTYDNIDSNKGKALFVGDLNIAPLETDVWSHKQLLKEVSHTPIEIELMTKWFITNNLIDLPRIFIPNDQKLYSWWSYRNKDYKKSNRGRRLDHAFSTILLKNQVKSAYYLHKTREIQQTSDHVPLIITLNY
ncbi:MAG: exodeoxyribonuclease III [Sphingobacteriia bacterium]|nr:exodeoxyribonuclease III [Sphingobacteriia bacterium]